MLSSLKKFYKENTFLAVLVSVTAVLILISGIYFKQEILKMLPLFISLIIMVLSAQVNRYSLLLGSVNSLIYCYYYYTTQLYSTLAYALVVSFPLQLIAFINWSKNSKGSITELKKMSNKQRIFTFALCVTAWIALYLIFSFLGSPYIILDNTSTLFGVIITILTMLRFSEYATLQLLNGLITILLHINIMATGNLSNITYLIFSIYSYICVIMAFIRMHKTHPHIIADNKRSS